MFIIQSFIYNPPGKKGTYQMVPFEFITTKNCKHVHLVEQVIQQAKTFKNMICCALVNLKPKSIFRD